MPIDESSLTHALANTIVKHIPLQDLPSLSGYSVAEDYWSDLAVVARRHGLGTHLLWALQTQDSVQMSSSVWTQLKSDRNMATLRYLLIAETVARVDDAFRLAKIPCIWIKGVALAPTVYPSAELRPMVDADVWVPYDMRKRALLVAEQLGYRMLDPQLFDGNEGLKHHYFLRGNKQDSVNLEVHFRLLGMADQFLPLEHHAWFWENTIEFVYDGRRYQTLRPEAHLLYLAAHALLQHGEADFHLQRYLDIHLLLTQSGAFDWQVVINQASVLGWTFCVKRALELAKTYFHTEIPDNVFAALDQRRPSYENIDYVTMRQVARPNARIVLDELAAMKGYTRLRALLRILFPPFAYMRWRYHTEHKWQIPLTYVNRIGSMIRDVVALVGKRVHTS